MTLRNKHIAKLDRQAVRELLAGLRASYRCQLDTQAVREKEELRRLIQDSYCPRKKREILDRLPKASEEAKNRILADTIDAALAMVDDIPDFAIGTRYRREGTRKLLKEMVDSTLLYADQLCNLLEIAAKHIEARLSLRAPALLDLLASIADSPELLPTAEVGPYLLRHLHTRDDLEADERAQIASYGHNLVPWQLGLVKLLLKLDFIFRLVVGDLGPVRSGERGAPVSPAERNAFRKSAGSWDRELGTKLLSPMQGSLSDKSLIAYNQKHRPYRKFLRFCEAAFAHAIELYRDNYKLDWPVRAAIGHRQRTSYEKKIATS
jgi:hypothetical protein